MEITLVGKKKIEVELTELKADLKVLREEKTSAYSLTGDTWHDNPYFYKLEQDERRLCTRIQEIEKLLREAELVEDTGHNTDEVAIGSIVKCRCVYDEDDQDTEIFEIVRQGENDIDNGKIHFETQVAKNIIGLHEGEQVQFETPGGTAIYKILRLYPDWDTAKGDQ